MSLFLQSLIGKRLSAKGKDDSMAWTKSLTLVARVSVVVRLNVVFGVVIQSAFMGMSGSFFFFMPPLSKET